MTKLPYEVELAYENASLVADKLREIAGKRLRSICSRNSWLFDDRVKQAESVLSKIEAGAGPVLSLHDLYATTVVVPTQNEVPQALQALRTFFTVVRTPSRSFKPEQFHYDDAHLIVKLRDAISPASLPNDVLDLHFEIQVRTGLQYAWWRATHDQVYKGDGSSVREWRLLRTQAQARASLEMLDAVLADLEGASVLQKVVDYTPGGDDRPIDWLSRWPEEQRPHDAVRFSKTVQALIAISESDVRLVEATLFSWPISDLLENSEVTPVQAVIAALHTLLGSEFESRLQAHDHRVLLTEAFLREYPALKGLPSSSRVEV